MELIKYDKETNCVDGMTLHNKLYPKYENDTKHLRDWINSLKGWGFVEGKDYFKSSVKQGKTYRHVYTIPINTAKEFCMLAKSRIGRIFRRYFILCEERLKQANELEYINATKNLVTCIDKQKNEILLLEERLKQTNELEYTACISDIVQEFEGLEPWEATYQLIGDGILCKRKNGVYPDPNYQDNNSIISVVDKHGRAYPRYTKKGTQLVREYFYNKGYRLKLLRG